MASQHRPILLVEDNPMDVDLTRQALGHRKLSNPIHVAQDGEEALSYLARWEMGETLPGVILLDISLPKIDGLRVLERLKSSLVSRMIPVIMLTASAENSDIQRAYALGVNSYIVKPVDFDKFVEVVAQIDIYWNLINIPPP